MKPPPTHIVLGAPWPGGVNGATWMSAERFANILSEGDAIMCAACSAGGGGSAPPPRFVWKSDTQTAPCNAAGTSFDRAKLAQGRYLTEQALARSPWLVLDLFKETESFGDECYNDGFHFNELARTYFNERLLRLLVDAEASGPHDASWCASACRK